jgi:hypothetical protein
MRLLLLLSLLLLPSLGRQTAGAAENPVRLARSRYIAPQAVGDDLRDGRRAALVACNLVVYAAATEQSRVLIPATRDRLTAAELRALNDAQLAAWTQMLTTVPRLELLPLSAVVTASAYASLPCPDASAPADLTLAGGPVRYVAPTDLKLILVPGSESDRWLHHTARDFPRRFDNFFKTFQKEMNTLAKALDVDFVVLVTTHVALVPSRQTADGWQAEVTLVEVVVVGRQLGRDFTYAKVATAPLGGAAAVPSAPLGADLAALLATPGKPAWAGLSFAEQPLWRQMAGGHQRALDAFRYSFSRQRGGQ